MSIMRCLCLLSFFLCFISYVSSFPSRPNASRDDTFTESLNKRQLLDLLTNPIGITDHHEFIPPNFDNGDQRGPCPALNALANHGYISRNGVTSMVEVTSAVNKVYGMGIDIATVLVTLSTVFVGNPLSLNPGFSIAGPSPSSQNILGNLVGLLGAPRGLNGSHNLVEADSSNTRGDLYVTGDASTMVMEQFQSFYDMASEDGTYDFDTYIERANIRFRESIATNPNFYYGPFTGMIARNAGYFFACRLLSNHTAGSTADIMDRETMKSFYAVQEKDGKLIYKRGWERIPENWYRRFADYGLVGFNLDLIALFTKYPEHASIGGNLGEVNTYAGVNVGDITGGVLNLRKLLKGNNLLCFVFEIVKTVAPNYLSTIFSAVATPLGLITDALDSTLLGFTCPAFKDLTVGGENFEDGIRDKFPGARRSSCVL